MKEIQLSQGFVTFVDDEDFERANQFKWFALKGTSTYYAQRNITINGKHACQYLHHFILNYVKVTGKRIITDHINHNGLDNRKINLRLCTFSQNRMNQIPYKDRTSIYKGVDFYSSRNVFRTRIVFNGKHKHVGYFKNEIDAAKAYDINAKKYYGEYANLNFHD